MKVLGWLLRVLKGKARMLKGKMKVLLIRLIWRTLLLSVIPSRTGSLITSNWYPIGFTFSLQKASEAK